MDYNVLVREWTQPSTPPQQKATADTPHTTKPERQEKDSDNKKKPVVFKQNSDGVRIGIKLPLIGR